MQGAHTRPLRAPAPGGSPSSRLPPGKHHSPFAGSLARRINSTCAATIARSSHMLVRSPSHTYNMPGVHPAKRRVRCSTHLGAGWRRPKHHHPDAHARLIGVFSALWRRCAGSCCCQRPLGTAGGCCMRCCNMQSCMRWDASCGGVGAAGCWQRHAHAPISQCCADCGCPGAIQCPADGPHAVQFG